MKKIVILFFLSTFFTVFNPIMSHAEESIDFSVKPQMTDSQIDDKDSYFNLRSSTGKREELPIKITNHAQETVEYIIKVNAATTNMNGIVDYTQSDVKQIATKNQFSDLVEKKEQTVSIASGEEKIIYIALTTPKTSFDGVILGGITVTKKRNEHSSSENIIKNEFQYAIAVQLSENDQKIESKLEGGEAQLTQINKRNAVKMVIKNPQAKVMKQIEGTFTITKKGQNTPIVKEERKAMSFAPNSEFFLFTMLNDKFKPGEYTYTIKVKNSDGNWLFKQDFSIDKKEATRLNNKSVDEAPKHFSAIYIIIIMGMVILILLIVLAYTFWKFQKIKKEQHEKIK